MSELTRNRLRVKDELTAKTETRPMRTVDPRAIRVFGDLENRIDLAIEWLLNASATFGNTDDWLLEDVDHRLPQHRFFELFTGDIWGAFIDCLSLFSRYKGEKYDRLERIVSRAISLQREDGSYWDFQPTEFELPNVVGRDHVWGWQRALLGLMEYYRTTREVRALSAAIKLGDFLVRLHARAEAESETKLADTVLGKGSPRMVYMDSGEPLFRTPQPPGVYWSSYWTAVIQGLTLLWQETGEDRYLTLVAEVADDVDVDSALAETTCSLSTMHGLLLLYEATNHEPYLKKARMIGDHILAQNSMHVTGEMPHFFNHPKTTETCGTADWLRVCLDLWRSTGDVKYLDMAERVMYNAFYYSQRRTGCSSSAEWSPELRDFEWSWWDDEDAETEQLNIRLHYGDPEYTGSACCAWHVPVGFFDILTNIYSQNERGVYVNLFVPSEVSLAVSGSQLHIRMMTAYPSDGLVRLQVSAPGVSFPLRIRVPYWARDVSLMLNGRRIEPKVQDGFVVIDREWREHDDVLFEMPLKLRLEYGDAKWGEIVNLSKANSRRLKRVVMMCGPLILGLDFKFNRNLSSLWSNLDMHILGENPSLYLPMMKGEAFFDLPLERPSELDNKFLIKNRHFRGLWILSSNRGRLDWAIGHLSPLCEQTGYHEPTSIRVYHDVIIATFENEDEVIRGALESGQEITSGFAEMAEDAMMMSHQRMVRVERLAAFLERAERSEDTDVGMYALAVARLADSSRTHMEAVTNTHVMSRIEPRALPPLIRSLGNRSWAVRKLSAKYLGRLGMKEATEPLRKALNDPNDLVRMAAAEALWHLGVRVP